MAKKRSKKKNPQGLVAAAAILGLLGVGAVALIATGKKKPATKAKQPVCVPNSVITSLRLASTGARSCGTCKHFDGSGQCLLYRQPVNSGCLCDSWTSMTARPREYGILVNAACTDFELREPPEGMDPKSLPQAQAMESIVEAAVATGSDIDPFILASQWLSDISPGTCSWPPSAAAPPRIRNMYIYTASLFAMMAIAAGADTILGLTIADAESYQDGLPLDEDTVDELDDVLLARAKALGLPDYDASTIPDLVPPLDTDEDDGLPPNLGEGIDGGFGVIITLPKVTEAIPSDFVASTEAAATTLMGAHLDQNAQFRLYDGELNLELPITMGMRTGSMAQLSFIPQLGEFQIYTRQGPNQSWRASGVVISIKPGQGGIVVGS